MANKQTRDIVAGDKRPPELVESLDRMTKRNDDAIVKVLEVLDDPSTRGLLKPTVDTIAELTGLSTNTIRNRPTALKRLREIKAKIKEEKKRTTAVHAEEKTPLKQKINLEATLENVLAQNALLYEEVLSLQATITRQDRVIAELTAKKLMIVKR